MEQLNAVKTLSALAHDGRLTLVRLLIQAGVDGVPAGDLARQAGVTNTTASAQLLVLANAGLIHSERQGRSIRYYARFETMTALLSFIMTDCCGNADAICQPAIRACCT